MTISDAHLLVGCVLLRSHNQSSSCTLVFVPLFQEWCPIIVYVIGLILLAISLDVEAFVYLIYKSVSSFYMNLFHPDCMAI